MPRLTTHSIETAPEAAKPRLEQAQRANGFLPNLLGVLANAPAALEMYQEVGKINAKTSLSPAEIEVVQITAAVENGCDFCVAGHSKIAAKKLHMPDATINALREHGRLEDAREAALATFTLALMRQKGKVSDEELQNFLAAGYSEQQVLEVTLGIALATLCNYANNIAQSDINPELAAFAPGARL